MGLIADKLPENLTMFLNMPQTLYILRMNADGSAVDLEEHKLLNYPSFNVLLNKLVEKNEKPIKANDLRAWGMGDLVEVIHYPFDREGGTTLKKLADEDEVVLGVQYDWDVNTLKSRVVAKRIEMTLEVAGEGRIFNFSIRKNEIEKERVTVQKTLDEYYRNVETVWKYFSGDSNDRTDQQVYGSENVRRERSLHNIELCSIVETFYLYEKPFLKMIYRLGYSFRIDPILTAYDIPSWTLSYMHLGGLSAHNKQEFLGSGKDFEEWMREIFRLPDNVETQKKVIIELIDKVYGIGVQKDDILYDFASECYLLKEDIERRMLDDKMPERDVETNEIAKYTTFEGLVAILQSGKIRMNSIVSMNDKTETDFLEDLVRNYKEEYEQDYDKFLFADKEFITSFTTRIDTLDMWRLYGDNARGVCMVFERNNKKNDDLYKISYIDPAIDLNKENELMETLKDMGVKFRLHLLQKYRHFMKHADYNSESEYRLLKHCEKTDGWFVNRDNGILTPYVECTLSKNEEQEEGDYPFKLTKVIVGPANNEMIANVLQVFYMGYQYGFSLEVAGSRIQSYR